MKGVKAGGLTFSMITLSLLRRKGALNMVSVSTAKSRKRGHQVARKKKLPTSETLTDQPVKQVPVVTPEIEGGYNGTVRA